MAAHLRTELVLAALDMAPRAAPTDRRDFIIRIKAAKCTSLAFGRRSREAGVRPSMGSVGDAYDNAMCVLRDM